MGNIGTYPPQNVTAQTPLLAYTEVTTPAPTIGAGPTDIPSLQVTVTVPAGRRLKISGNIPHFWYSDATTSHLVQVYKNGVLFGTLSWFDRVAGGESATLSNYVVDSPVAGTHTYKLVALRSTGSGTVLFHAAATEPQILMVEDITGSQLPVLPQSVPVGLLAQARVTANQPGITTQAAINGLSVNVSVPEGRTLKIRAEAYFENSAVNVVAGARMFLQQDGVAVQQVDHRLTAINVPEKFIGEVIVSPTAGSHTYRVTADNGGGGTVQLIAGTAYPAILTVEDITPTPAPGQGAPASTLGYAQITSTSLTTGSLVTTDIPGLEVTVTVPAGRRLLITGHLIGYSATVPGKIAATIREGTTVLGNGEAMTTVSNYGVTGHAEAVVTPSAGTHTYKLSFTAAIQTGSLYADANLPCYILVEDITGAVWPVGSAITSGMVASEAWTPYSPTFSNITIGNGTAVGRYQKIGRTVHCAGKFTLGSTSAVTSWIYMNLPITAAAGVPVTGIVYAQDSGFTHWMGTFYAGSVNDGPITSGAGASSIHWNATQPFTWAVGDWFQWQITYEAAS